MELLKLAEKPARRFLLMKSENTVNILWLDEPGTCTHETAVGDQYRTRWHLHRDEKGRVFTSLCPNGLERGEWARVFVDEPPGTWISHYQDYCSGPTKKSRASFEEAV